jgi:pimeloyl-ACP methyl ester carboxylesterase
MSPVAQPLPSLPRRGSVLVLLPGLVCDRAAWEPMFEGLGAGADCRVHETGPDSSLGAMAERVLAAAPASFALAGHSMGGRVALEIMRRASERVERVALLDTGWRARPAGGAGDDERAGRLALLAIAREQGMRAMGQSWVQRMVHPARLTDDRLMDAILDMIERQTPDRFAMQIEALLARPDAGDVLRGIRCPALVLCGRQDAWSALAQHEEMATMVPGARLAVIADCGHMATMEQPERVADALLEWLRVPATNHAADHSNERRWAS